MSTKDLSKELWDKVVERYRSGDGYKNISKDMNIPWNTVKTIVKKWKVYGTTKTLPRSGYPSKLGDQARTRLIKEANDNFLPWCGIRDTEAKSLWQRLVTVCM